MLLCGFSSSHDLQVRLWLMCSKKMMTSFEERLGVFVDIYVHICHYIHQKNKDLFLPVSSVCMGTVSSFLVHNQFFVLHSARQRFEPNYGKPPSPARKLGVTSRGGGAALRSGEGGGGHCFLLF